MRYIMRIILSTPVAALFLIYFNSTTYAQSTAGEKAIFESRYVVEMPTAGVIPKGNFCAYGSSFAGGGVLTQIEAAPFENFNMGISFSGVRVIGGGEIKTQNMPGVTLKYRLFDEKSYLPAILIGASNQGRGEFSLHNERFETVSPGAYAALSKNYSWFLGTAAFHGGLNYSFEPKPEDRSPNFYFGLEHSLGSRASVNFEYNAGLDDRFDEREANSGGLVNAALRWSLIRGFTVEMQFRDLLGAEPNSPAGERSICVEYVGVF